MKNLKYTKKDEIFIRIFGHSFDDYSSYQRLAGIFFLLIINSKFLVEEIKSIGLENDFQLISDSPSSEPNHNPLWRIDMTNLYFH